MNGKISSIRRIEGANGREGKTNKNKNEQQKVYEEIQEKLKQRWKKKA